MRMLVLRGRHGRDPRSQRGRQGILKPHERDQLVTRQLLQHRHAKIELRQRGTVTATRQAQEIQTKRQLNVYLQDASTPRLAWVTESRTLPSLAGDEDLHLDHRLLPVPHHRRRKH
jgi:hypothetical protein